MRLHTFQGAAEEKREGIGDFRKKTVKEKKKEVELSFETKLMVENCFGKILELDFFFFDSHLGFLNCCIK